MLALPSIPPSSLIHQSTISLGQDASVFLVAITDAARFHLPPSPDNLYVCKKHVIRSSLSVPRFTREVSLLPTPCPSHLVCPLAVVTSPPVYAQILPYAPLADVSAVSARPDLTAHHICSLARDMAIALAQLHDECGLVHRDIKSSNFLVFADGRARLSDFGSARPIGQVSDELDEAGPSRGFHKKRLRGTTTVFAAPEVLTSSSGEQACSDVYSLGVALAELATGLAPYSCSLKESPALNTVVDATYSEQALCQEICYAGLRPLDSPTARDALERRLGPACAQAFAQVGRTSASRRD